MFFVTFVDNHRYLCYQCVYLAHSVNDVLDDTLQNHDRSQNFSVRKWILDHNSKYCGHRSKPFHKSNTSFQMKTLKNLSNVFQKTTNVLVQISASTGRGDFNNSTNVTHTQIQLMMMI